MRTKRVFVWFARCEIEEHIYLLLQRGAGRELFRKDINEILEIFSEFLEVEKDEVHPTEAGSGFHWSGLVHR